MTGLAIRIALVMALLTGAAQALDGPFATPEAHGFSSDRLAQVLDAAKASGEPLHSLTLVRSGDVVLDAAFYPYDGATLHDMASVTKSVTTTLVATAAAEGRLVLRQPADRPSGCPQGGRHAAAFDAEHLGPCLRGRARGGDPRPDGGERRFRAVRPRSAHGGRTRHAVRLLQPGNAHSFRRPPTGNGPHGVRLCKGKALCAAWHHRRGLGPRPAGREPRVGRFAPAARRHGGARQAVARGRPLERLADHSRRMAPRRDHAGGQVGSPRGLWLRLLGGAQG